ncbi:MULTISPECIES: alpha-E domain-containing protein [Rhodomicrobium]|uniref:alpha-E domain-containing protein n=1 Tax=Rhodomicrobium TaxID=1068 RepID=UPI00148295D4|nr:MULTISPECIES: alpha-E domain-containing protein [Rhodomicrobium]
MTTTLLSRHAECAFWLARYLERAESMARILEAHSSFQRGRSDGQNWAWIIALYSDQENFAKKFPETSAKNVISYYVTQLDNPSSIQASIRSARENARALRPLISTDMWTQLNDFYNRILGLGEGDFSENRLSRSCDTIKRGCYAEIGVAESTLYRDESWPFFRLGLFIERADQTSRLLDVQFAQRAVGVATNIPEQQVALWNALLRSASAYHSFRRAHHRGLDPADVARFLIFDTRLPRSIAFCAGEIQRMVSQLRGEFRLRNAQRAFERVESFQADLQKAVRNEGLLDGLHGFNDWVQSELMQLTSELGTAFFGHLHETASPEIEPTPTPPPGISNGAQSQSSQSGQIQSQS